MQLYKHDLSANPRLERVRDLFVFACCTGLRFSDFSTIKRENIIERQDGVYISKITTKTEEAILIPCNGVVIEIFEKHANSVNSLPHAPSNQKFNDYIKECCKLADLTEKGRLQTDLNKELWECVTSHTARRSFATNLYRDGISTIDIMKFTGHRTEKAFLNYIKVTKLDAAKKLNQHFKKKSIKPLRAVV